jgi:RNA methyltransferase, TrmH family
MGSIDMTELFISSTQNPQIKQIVNLRDRQERDKQQLFLIEGYREILRAMQAGWKMTQIFVCEEFFLGENEPALIQQLVARGTQLITTSEKVFQKISYRDRPDGLLAVAPQRRLQLEDIRIKNGNPPFYVVAEAIEKPGNLGTILRSSDAVGVVRASVGTLFSVPTVEANGQETLDWLKSQGISILAATPHAKEEFTKIDVTGPIAIAVGTEQLGLSDRWMKQADKQVRIPMNGVADSLNVAMATTLLLYEVHRQRHL